MNKKKLLIISYFFPPFSGGGVIRVHNLVKYKPDNIDLNILTIKSEFYEKTYLDNSLEKNYKDIKIFRTNMVFGRFLKKQRESVLISKNNKKNSIKSYILRIIKKYFLPDEFFLWIVSGFIFFYKNLRKKQYDGIISTAPPFSANILNLFISIVFKVPMYLDYRDLWIEKNFISKIFEYLYFLRAKKIIVTNKQAKEKLIKGYSFISKKIFIVENGFDGEELDFFLKRDEIDKKKDNSFNINYFGSLTEKRTPEFFFQAFNRVLLKFGNKNFKVKFYGFVSPKHYELVGKYNLENIIEFKGTLSYKESIKKMFYDSDTLLLFQKSNEGGDTAIPGKLYEYLMTGNPVLTMDEGKGATSIFLEDHNYGNIVDYQNVEAIEMNLSYIIENYDIVKNDFINKRKNIFKFDRRILSKKFFEIIEVEQ